MSADFGCLSKKTSLFNSPPIPPVVLSVGKLVTIVCLMGAKGGRCQWSTLNCGINLFVGPTEIKCPDFKGTLPAEAFLGKESKYDRLSSYSRRNWQWLIIRLPNTFHYKFPNTFHYKHLFWEAFISLLHPWLLHFWLYASSFFSLPPSFYGKMPIHFDGSRILLLYFSVSVINNFVHVKGSIAGSDIPQEQEGGKCGTSGDVHQSLR